MPTYSLMVSKNNKWDKKNSLDCAQIYSKEMLDAEFERLKQKYNAIEIPEKQTQVGPMFQHGLFKIAVGTCKHNKTVEIQYSEMESPGGCIPPRV